MWVPQTIGSPALGANKPGRYWPGGGYVDWIGADIYSKFATPGIWAAFKRFYSHWRNPQRHHWPFVVGEYSPWDNDYHGALHAAPVQLGAPPPARASARLLPERHGEQPLRHQ